MLPRRVGLHRAKELALLADIIDATEADRIGLVNRVVPDAELDEFVADWAARLAAGPPIALAQAKRLLDDGVNLTLEQALDAEGRGPDGQLLHRRHGRGRAGVPGEADADVPRSLTVTAEPTGRGHTL